MFHWNTLKKNTRSICTSRHLVTPGFRSIYHVSFFVCCAQPQPKQEKTLFCCQNTQIIPEQSPHGTRWRRRYVLPKFTHAKSKKQQQHQSTMCMRFCSPFRFNLSFSFFLFSSFRLPTEKCCLWVFFSFELYRTCL